jgi:hypothetical protein
VNSPHLAGKPRFCEQSENRVHGDCPPFVREFSEGSGGSSFFEWKWTVGSMSRLDGKGELQTTRQRMVEWCVADGGRVSITATEALPRLNGTARAWFAGKSREIPVRHDLETILSKYMEAAGLQHAPKGTPVFQSALRKQRILTGKAITGDDIYHMMKRRLKD